MPSSLEVGNREDAFASAKRTAPEDAGEQPGRASEPVAGEVPCQPVAPEIALLEQQQGLRFCVVLGADASGDAVLLADFACVLMTVADPQQILGITFRSQNYYPF